MSDKFDIYNDCEGVDTLKVLCGNDLIQYFYIFDIYNNNLNEEIKRSIIDLRKNDVKVVSATESISKGAEGIILESVLEGMAEYYSADLAEKVSRGMTENALKCRFLAEQR